MRYIEFKIVAINSNLTLDYKRLLLEYAQSPLPGGQGIGVAEMRKAIRVIDKLEAANGIVALEDADWEFLNQRVQAAQFTLAHKVIVEFVDAVANAPTEEPTRIAERDD